MSKRWLASAGVVLIVVFAVFMVGYYSSSSPTGFGLFDKVSFKVNGVQVGNPAVAKPVSVAAGQCRDYDGGNIPLKGSYTLIPKTKNTELTAKGDFCKNNKVLVEQTCSGNKQASAEVDCSKQKLSCLVNTEGYAYCGNPAKFSVKQKLSIQNKLIKEFDTVCGEAQKLFGPIKTQNIFDEREVYPIDFCAEKLPQRYLEAFLSGDVERANTILLRIHYFFLGSNSDTGGIADWVLAKYYNNLFTKKELNSMKNAGVVGTLGMAVYIADVKPDGFTKRTMINGGVQADSPKTVGAKVTGKYHWRGHMPERNRNNIFINAAYTYAQLADVIMVYDPGTDGLVTIDNRDSLRVNDAFSIQPSRCGDNGAMTCAVGYLIDPVFGSFNGCTLKTSAEHDFSCPDSDVCSRNRNQVSSTEKIDTDYYVYLGAEAPTEAEYYENTCEPENRRTGRDGGEEGPGGNLPSVSPFFTAGLCLPPPNSAITGLNRILQCNQDLIQVVQRTSEFDNPACPGESFAAEGEDSGGGTEDPCADVTCPSGQFCSNGVCQDNAPAENACPGAPCPSGHNCGAGGYCYPEREEHDFDDDPIIGDLPEDGEDVGSSESEIEYIYDDDFLPDEEIRIANGLTGLETGIASKDYSTTYPERVERIAHCVESSGMCPGCTFSDVAATLDRVNIAAGNSIGEFYPDDPSARVATSTSPIVISVRIQRAPIVFTNRGGSAIAYVSLSGINLPDREYEITLSSRGVEPNTITHELLHVVFHELGIPQNANNDFAHGIMGCIEEARAVFRGTVDIVDSIVGGDDPCTLLDDILRECEDLPGGEYVDSTRWNIFCPEPDGACGPAPGELQPALDCLASQDNAGAVYSGAIIKASRPGPDCQYDTPGNECCRLNPSGTRCIDVGAGGRAVGEFFASQAGCGPDMTPVDPEQCDAACEEGEELGEGGGGFGPQGAVCSTGGTNPPPGAD